MSNFRRPIAMCLVLLWSSVAAATITYSPPVRSDEGDILGCVAQNLRDVTVAVTAEINNGLGAIVDSATLDVPAGQSRTVVSTASTVFAAYCKFTFAGTAERVRGYIQLFDLGGSDTRLLFPAAEIEGVSARGLKTYSPPLRNESGVLSCVVQNLSDATVEVTAEVESGLGGPVVDSGTMAIPAGRALVVASTATVRIGAFCTFTFDGSAAAVRGYIQLYDAGGSNTRLLYAASLAGGRQFAGTVTYTVPVRSFADDRLSCIAENLSDDTVSVSAELNDGSNDDRHQRHRRRVRRPIDADSTRNNVGAGYCKFTFDGSAADVRGYIRLSRFRRAATRVYSFRFGRRRRSREQHGDLFAAGPQQRRQRAFLFGAGEPQRPDR
jgi:acylphosphatase